MGTNNDIPNNLKKSEENNEENSDDVGNKWSISALNKHFEEVGIDCSLLWNRIYDGIIKCLLSGEASIVSALRRILPN